MVRRFPHTATVVIETGGYLDRGKYVKGKTREIIVRGRYETVSNGRGEVVKKNANGDDKIVRAEFYTAKRKIEGVIRMKIPELAVDVDIICWDDFQSYSVVSL